MAPRHNNMGRSVAVSAKPPEGSSWAWITKEMLECHAWQMMRPTARKVLDRIMLEHLAHAGKANGELIVTYNDFARYGIRRASLPRALCELEALGLIEIVHRGGGAIAEHRDPSRYALSWLPTTYGTQASNRWQSIKSQAEARAAVLATERQVAKTSKPVAKTHTTGREIATNTGHENATSVIQLRDAKSGLLSISSVSSTEDADWADFPDLPAFLDRRARA